MSKPIDVLVVEDNESHFEETSKVYLEAGCKIYRITLNRLERLQTQEGAEAFIQQAYEANHALIIIFDVLMEGKGSPKRLDEYVKHIIKQTHDEWLKHVPNRYFFSIR